VLAVVAWAFLAGGSAVALAEPTASDEEILTGERTREPRVTVERAAARLTFFDQYGRGYHSKAGPPEGPGDLRLTVWQPAGQLTLRQRDKRFSHNFIGTVDIVTAASADALDAVSSASRYNEAGTLDVTSTFEHRPGSAFSIRYGAHAEEPLRSGFAGLGYSRAFNDEQTVATASVVVIADYFDDLYPRGWNDEQTWRVTGSENFSVTQVLSPTTLAVASYGVTFQAGTLEQGWNSVYIHDHETYGCYDDPEQARPYDCVNRRREEFPRTRTRHALSAQVNQHIPRTRSTLKLRYRYYVDDVSLRAHTGTFSGYQWFGRRFYVRLQYRLHHQTGVDFYAESISMDVPENVPVTADSDLAPFFSHMGSIRAVLYLTPPGSARGGAQTIDASYARYERTNDLRMNVFGVGWGKEF
jgi:hypothetical protein